MALTVKGGSTGSGAGELVPSTPPLLDLDFPLFNKMEDDDDEEEEEEEEEDVAVEPLVDPNFGVDLVVDSLLPLGVVWGFK